MGCSKSLVQVHMQHVKAHIARFDRTQNGIKVGAVVIKQAAGFVNRGGDLFNPALKYASR